MTDAADEIEQYLMNMMQHPVRGVYRSDAENIILLFLNKQSKTTDCRSCACAPCLCARDD